jgi:hypothetical protein
VVGNFHTYVGIKEGVLKTVHKLAHKTHTLINTTLPEENIQIYLASASDYDETIVTSPTGQN